MAALTATALVHPELKPSFSLSSRARRRTKNSHPAFPVCVFFLFLFLFWVYLVLNSFVRVQSKLIVFCYGFDRIRWQGCSVRLFSKLQS